MLDLETAALPQWREERPPLVLRADGSIASKRRRYAPEAPLDPYRSRIRLVHIAGAHRPGGPNRAVVIDVDQIPVTGAALAPVWRSKLWILNAAFDVKHLLAGVDLSHAEIVDAMLLAAWPIGASLTPACRRQRDRPWRNTRKPPPGSTCRSLAKCRIGRDRPFRAINSITPRSMSQSSLIPASWERLPDEHAKACVWARFPGDAGGCAAGACRDGRHGAGGPG